MGEIEPGSSGFGTIGELLRCDDGRLRCCVGDFSDFLRLGNLEKTKRCRGTFFLLVLEGRAGDA